MIAFLVVLAVILTVAFCRIQVAAYSSVVGFAVTVKIGFFTVFSTEKKNKRKKRKKREAKKEKLSEKVPKDRVRSVICALGKITAEIRRAIRIDSLNIDFVIAGDDPHDTAILYAGVNILVCGLLSVLHELLRIKKQHISIQLDFERSQPLYYGLVRISTSIGRIFILCIRFIWEIWNITRLR